MSVTFTPELVDTDSAAYEVWCDNGTLIATFLTYLDATHAADTHGQVCSEDLCRDYGADVRAVSDVPEVNVSDTNAYYLLGLLGLNEDAARGVECPDPLEFGAVADVLSGSCSAEDFLGRVLVAQALSGHDAGVPTTVTTGFGLATVYDCGRPVGYIDERLARLRDLATWACQRERTIYWS